MPKIMHIDQNYTNGMNIVPIYQADYNALSYDEKHDPNIWYYLLDATIAGAVIDDTDTSANEVWSSLKTSTEIEKGNFIKVTQEEYDVLPTADKQNPNKYYLITDTTVSGGPIDDNSVSVGKVWSSKKVNDEITDLNSNIAKNVIGTTVELTSTPYTFPCDGYVICSARGTDGMSYAEIKDGNGTPFLYPSVQGSTWNNTFQQVTYVKKGMSATGAKAGASSANIVTFIPLTSTV